MVSAPFEGPEQQRYGRMLAAFVAVLAPALVQCGVPERGGPGQGVHLDDGPCGRGIVIVASDYASTNVLISRLDGTVASDSILSSGSAASGLTAALSGDVVLPLEPPRSRRVVLIDRGQHALTWLDVEQGQVTGQLSVATGFAANPHDYLELGDGRAYVTRYASNPAPGREPFDQGSDLLMIDANERRIVGRIDLTQGETGEYLPRPDRMLASGGRVYVVLQRFSADFTKASSSRLVAVDPDTDTLVWSYDLQGLSNCGGLARSPTGASIAVSCTGGFLEGDEQIERSGIVLFDATQEPMQETARYQLAHLGGPLSPSIRFASEHRLVGVTYGNLDTGRPDTVYELDVTTGQASELARAATAFVLGDVWCATECGQPCVLADAEAVALRRWELHNERLQPWPSVDLRAGLGLGPRAMLGY